MLPPLDSLDWSDERGVVGHVRALLAECGHPMPRQGFLDGKAIPIFAGDPDKTPRPFDAATLRDLANGDSPQVYYRRLLGGDGTRLERSMRAGHEIATLVATLGIWPFATAWFKYPGQLHTLETILAAKDDTELRVLVHGTFNGEDAYSIATYLNATLARRKISVFGRDALAPRIDDLQWVACKRVPSAITIDDYFERQTAHVASLRPEMHDLVDLDAGDAGAAECHLDRLDAVVINGVLGQAVSADALPQHLDRIRETLAPGGVLLIDNTAYAIAHPELDAALRSEVERLVERSAFHDERHREEARPGRYVLRKS